jgi:hypothetical protein
MSGLFKRIKETVNKTFVKRSLDYGLCNDIEYYKNQYHKLYDKYHTIFNSLTQQWSRVKKPFECEIVRNLIEHRVRLLSTIKYNLYKYDNGVRQLINLNHSATEDRAVQIARDILRPNFLYPRNFYELMKDIEESMYREIGFAPLVTVRSTQSIQDTIEQNVQIVANNATNKTSNPLLSIVILDRFILNNAIYCNRENEYKAHFQYDGVDYTQGLFKYDVVTKRYLFTSSGYEFELFPIYDNTFDIERQNFVSKLDKISDSIMIFNMVSIFVGNFFQNNARSNLLVTFERDGQANKNGEYIDATKKALIDEQLVAFTSLVQEVLQNNTNPLNTGKPMVIPPSYGLKATIHPFSLAMNETQALEFKNNYKKEIYSALGEKEESIDGGGTFSNQQISVIESEREKIDTAKRYAAQFTRLLHSDMYINGILDYNKYSIEIDEYSLPNVADKRIQSLIQVANMGNCIIVNEMRDAIGFEKLPDEDGGNKFLLPSPSDTIANPTKKIQTV